MILVYSGSDSNLCFYYEDGLRGVDESSIN